MSKAVHDEMAWRSVKGRGSSALRLFSFFATLALALQHLQHFTIMRTSFVLLPALAMAALAAPAPGQLDKRQNIIGCVSGFEGGYKGGGKGGSMLL